MAHYAAFDVSDKETAIHVLDEHGKPVWKGKRASEPEVLATALRRHAPELVRVGLETGQLAPWLYHSLQALGVPVVCLDARHARAATAVQRNKTDARDAETLAQLVRTGWCRAARVKGWAAHAVRHLVNARAQLARPAVWSGKGHGTRSAPSGTSTQAARQRGRVVVSAFSNRTSCLPTGATDAAKRRHGGRPPAPGAPVPGARVGHEQAADPWQLPKAERVGVETHRPLLRDGVPLFKRPT